MPQDFSTLRINSDRMLDSFTQVFAFGSTADGGVNRPSFSEEHLQARTWFREQIEKSGFEFRTDGAGNHSAFLYCADANAPTLIVGSHLDSVPNGGKYDGGLGVVSAFEVLKIIQENKIKLKVNLEAMDFTDEEGTLVGLLGSAAIAGHLHQKDLYKPRGGRDNLLEAMKRAGLSDESMLSAVRKKETLAGYIELHIEQGKRLEKSKINIGIVSAIVGIASYRLTFLGKANHAGTTTMEDRIDASLGASSFTLKARELVMSEYKNSVVNVGKMEFAPGAFNIVPETVNLSLEFRSATQKEFDKLDEALISLAKREAEKFGLELKIEFLGKHPPSPMSDKVQTAFANACDDLGLTHTSLTSGAGHDAQSLEDLCPVGMIFVPSVNGISHSPKEFTEWEDCVNGANVLLQTVLRLARE